MRHVSGCRAVDPRESGLMVEPERQLWPAKCGSGLWYGSSAAPATIGTRRLDAALRVLLANQPSAETLA